MPAARGVVRCRPKGRRWRETCREALSEENDPLLTRPGSCPACRSGLADDPRLGRGVELGDGEHQGGDLHRDVRQVDDLDAGEHLDQVIGVEHQRHVVERERLRALLGGLDGRAVLRCGGRQVDGGELDDDVVVDADVLQVDPLDPGEHGLDLAHGELQVHLAQHDRAGRGDADQGRHDRDVRGQVGGLGGGLGSGLGCGHVSGSSEGARPSLHQFVRSSGALCGGC